MMDNLKMILEMGKGDYLIRMEIIMKENSKTTTFVDTE